VDDRGRKTYLKTFTGPRGGKYAIDAQGRKRYIRS
jgi:hypothetical protein